VRSSPCPTTIGLILKGRIAQSQVGQLSISIVITLSHGVGLVTAARAILKCNQLKADIVLYVARAGELTADWLANPPISGAHTVQAADIGQACGLLGVTS
jgi:hypothetical protein